MCATKPSASCPHSPSRTSSSACALDGMRSSPRQRLSPAMQLDVVGVLGDRDRPGVRDRHRHRAHADHAGHAEPLDDLTDGLAERLPAGVGLGAVEQEVRRPAGVLEQADDQTGGVVGLVVVAHERHGRSAGAVVVELVDVERRHHGAALTSLLVHQVPGGTGGRVAGVEEAVEHEDEGQGRVVAVVEPGDLVDDVDQPLHHVTQRSDRPAAPAVARSPRPAAGRPSRP